jgi:carboxyl-terminal processing protease
MNPILLFMKRNYKALVLVGVFAIALWSFMPKNETIDASQHSQKDILLLELVVRVLESGHYSHVEINDDFSKGLYNSYLEALDPNKRFFIQSDIEEFSAYETNLDDQIKNRDISFFDFTYTRLMRRIDEAKEYYKEILDRPFDFEKDEVFNLDFENQKHEKDLSALKDKWRKQMKLSVLSKIYDKEKTQKDTKEDDLLDLDAEETLAETKKPEEPKEIKSFEQLEKETREAELKIFEDYFDFIKEQTRDDWYAVFINAITEQFDPHTNYLAPQDKEKFDVSMSGKFEGIGAKLMKKGDFIEVSELISGGPAWREGLLEAGDLITKVAQEDGEAVDIAGMRMDNVIKLIKGKKGTKVILTVKRVDGSIKDIPISRDVVELEETYARSTIVENDDKNYGVIYLPKFYFDVEDNKSRDAAKDVALEIERLKKENIEGLIIDLRDNGGGSLRTAVDISGLFIEKGPVVQVRNPSERGSSGKLNSRNIDIHQDRDNKIQWEGPLVVLVNNFSASASEIFAAAMQDYNRGIVIGSKHTYGKGTVQNFAVLNNFIRNSDIDFGAVKITTQKFYRINGGSTQLKGVESDIVLPDRYTYIDMGERDLKTAMPWDEIPAADYKMVAPIKTFAPVLEKSKKRIGQDETFKLIDQSAKWISQVRKEYDYNINYKKFTEREEYMTLKRKEFDKLKDYKNTLKFSSLPYEIEQIKQDSVLGKKRERWHKNLNKDIYVGEAVNILEDLAKVNAPKKLKK